MSTIKGVTMLRVIGMAATAALVSVGGTYGGRSDVAPRTGVGAEAPIDISALLAAANGAPPMICALAAQSVRNYGWGGWTDAPATPLAAVRAERMRDGNSSTLPDADVDRLVAGIGSGDACVREIAVRMLGSQRSNERVASALLSRLSAPDVPTREVAAYGL